MNRELDAAGIHDPALRSSYEACRRLNAVHGRTYYLATLLLPPAKRPHVHALYGFARYADDIVDDLSSGRTPTEREQALDAWCDAALRPASRTTGPQPWETGAPKPRLGHNRAVLSAMRHTMAEFGIPIEHVEAFLRSMRMDLEVTEYRTYGDLLHYMHGSAAVIGLQMLPVLGHPDVPFEVVAPYARDLGIGFQLTNFIRDVGEDLRRGRLYLPLEDLERFGVTRERLEAGVLDEPTRRLLSFEVGRAREALRSAAPGIRLVDPTSRDCLRTALTLYGGILDVVERDGYRVLDRRAAVGRTRRLAIAARALLQARRARARR